MKTPEEIDQLINAILACVSAIHSETIPMNGHSDPGAITDCFNEVYDGLSTLKQSYHAQFEGKNYFSPTEIRVIQETAYNEGYQAGGLNDHFEMSE
jgi:hypothetical protein